MIAFVKYESHLDQVPAGLVHIFIGELERIFPTEDEGPSIDTLRLIYEAKKMGGGGVIDAR